MSPHRRPRGARSLDLSARAGGGAATALVMVVALLPARAARAAEGEPYLVAPFENASSVKALDWQAAALALTLAEKLEAVPQLRPAFASTPLAGPLDGWAARFEPDKAIERAREAGARWVFTGSFSRPSWKAGVKVRLLQVDGGALTEVAAAEAVGGRDELLAVLDRAVDQVLAKRGWLPQGEALAALHRAPTRDLYAFTLFGRALGALHGLNGPEDLALAEKTLERATHIDPRFAEAHRVLGRIYLARGDKARAAGQLAYALDLKPGYYAALAGLARIYRADNKRQPAREMAERALALRPWDVEMRQLLGTMELEAGELERALADLLKVCEARPRNLGAQRTLAQIRAARGEVAELAAVLEKVIELAPDDLEARLDLGSALMRVGRNEQAIAVYEEVLRRQPRHAQAVKFLGDLQRRQGDPQKAVAAYERLKHLAPEDPRAYFLLGAAYAEAGREDKAAAVLEEAQQFRAYQGEAWADLGALALRRGDLKKAEALLTRAVARSPMRPRARFNYALLLDAKGERDRALGEARLAGELDPEEADFPYLAGVICLRLGRLEEAKAAFAEAVRLRPAHAEARHNLALLEDLDRRYGAEHAGMGAR